MITQFLIVDDCADDRYLLSRHLKRIAPGVPIVEAGEATEALPMLASDIPAGAVVFLDVNMPLMNGFDMLEVLAEMRESEPRLEDVSVVIFSSSAHPDDIRRAKAYPFVLDFLSKDAPREDIRDVVQRADHAMLVGV